AGRGDPASARWRAPAATVREQRRRGTRPRGDRDRVEHAARQRDAPAAPVAGRLRAGDGTDGGDGAAWRDRTGAGREPGSRLLSARALGAVEAARTRHPFEPYSTRFHADSQTVHRLGACADMGATATGTL